jgi:RNA polymerase sigma-70 factor (ECF subfamily)
MTVWYERLSHCVEERPLVAVLATPFERVSVGLTPQAPALADDSDDVFVLRAIAGDGTAFVTLVERYKRAVYSLAYRLLGNAADAEDAAQETFVRAYTRLNTYQPGSRFGSWLLSITSHWCIDFLRRRRAVSLDEMEVRPVADLISDHPESLALQSERRDEVQRWLNTLPDPYRSVLVLRYWQELSYSEISDATGLPVSTIRMRLFRARQLLAKERGSERAAMVM